MSQTDIQKQWDLALIPVVLRNQAKQAIEKRDAVGLLCLIENTKSLEFVIKNAFHLGLLGTYEAALIKALTIARINNALYPPSFLERLFEDGDIEKFQAAGDTLPLSNMFTIYRGVSGEGGYRHVRGLSWTASLNIACWFALRFAGYGLKNPSVYKTNIKREDVYCYITDRDEQEFICRPKYCKRLNLSIERMEDLKEGR